MKKVIFILFVALSSCQKDKLLLHGEIIEYYIQFNTDYSSSINVIAHLEIVNPYNDSILLYITDNYSKEHPFCVYNLIIGGDTLLIENDQYYNVETYISPSDTFRFYMKIFEFNPYKYSFKDIKLEYEKKLMNSKIVYYPNIKYINYNYVNPIIIYSPIKKINTIYIHDDVVIDTNNILMEKKLHAPNLSDSLIYID